MWQDFKDFITIDNLHIFCFWFLIILTVVGLIEIIYQIRNAVRKINIADEYIKHIDIIQKHVAKRLHARKQYGFVDTKSLLKGNVNSLNNTQNPLYNFVKGTKSMAKFCFSTF